MNYRPGLLAAVGAVRDDTLRLLIAMDCDNRLVSHGQATPFQTIEQI